MSVETKVMDVFADNMCFYWLSHSSHVNITGRNFEADHALLDEIYSDAQAQIDTLAEFIRTLRAKVPTSLIEIVESSSITVTTSENDSADELLQSVLDGLEQLVSCYTELFDVATAEGEQQIANYAADRMGVHKKSIWKLESTLA